MEPGRLFPADVAFALMRPGDPIPDPLPKERALLTAQALPDRVAEFARGRGAARQALAELGLSGAESFPILRAGLRAPRWPEGVVGAITHSGSWAAAAVAWKIRYAGIGLDLERARTPRPQLVARIALPEERLWLDSIPETRRALAFALLFSAKESIYKALHPVTNVFLGYGDAVVRPRPLTPTPPSSEGVSRPHPLTLSPPSGEGEADSARDVGSHPLSLRERGWEGEATPPSPAGEGGRGGEVFGWTLLRDSGPSFPKGFGGEGSWCDLGEVVLTAIAIPVA
jgi:4'-phosphopantetheinyl transferase EntD